MREWQEWSAANTAAPVPGDCIVDILFEDECVYTALAAAQVEWFSLHHRVALWRESERGAEAGASAAFG